MKYGSGVIVSLIAVMMITFSAAGTLPYADASHDKATVSVSFFKKNSLANIYQITVSGGLTTIDVQMTAKDYSAFKRACGDTSVELDGTGPGSFVRCDPGKGILTVSINITSVHDGKIIVNAVKAPKN